MAEMPRTAHATAIPGVTFLSPLLRSTEATEYREGGSGGVVRCVANCKCVAPLNFECCEHRFEQIRMGLAALDVGATDDRAAQADGPEEHGVERALPLRIGEPEGLTCRWTTDADERAVDPPEGLDGPGDESLSA